LRWLLLVLLVGCAASGRTETAHPTWARIASASAGQGPVVAVVFASWCGHCRDELAMLSEVHAERPALRIVGLNAYEDWEGASDAATLAAYLAEHAPWLPVVRADDAMLAALGGVPKIPSLFVFSADGRLVEAYRRHERRAPAKDELLRLVDAL
jgi:thiol-disulfide isomerase/thioredoxin